MQTGIMLAFYLPPKVASQLYTLVEAAGVTPVEPEAMHLTLLFMGDTNSYDDGERMDIQQSVQRFIDGQGVAIDGIVSGIGRFNTDEDSDTNALYASFDSPDLPVFRQGLFAAVAWNLATEQQHGFTPHITLAYIPADAPMPDIQLPVLDVSFDTLTLAWGDEHIRYGIQKAGKTMPEVKAAKDESKSKVYRPFSQKETAYTTLHTNPTQACANCRFFKAHSWDSDGPFCHIVESWPEPILATGWCNEWRVVVPEAINIEPLPVVIVDEVESVEELVGAMTAGSDVRLSAAKSKTLLGKLQDMVGKALNRAPPGTSLTSIGFKIYDDGRWAALYSNNYEDNDRETFPAAAIDEYIDGVKTGRHPWPVLQYAHLSATTHGTADNLWRLGHHVLATGTFEDTDLAGKLRDYGRKCASEGKPLYMSHRFWFNPKDRTPDGVYQKYQTFEISWFPLLPGVKPANPLTMMEMKTMTIPPALEKNLIDILGETRAKSIIATSEAMDNQALIDRRASKTQEQPETPAPDAAPAPEIAAIKAQMEQQNDLLRTALAALETAQKTFETQGAALAAATQENTDLKAKFAKYTELQTPASQNTDTALKEGELTKWLDAQDKKTSEQSIVGQMLGNTTQIVGQ